MELFQIKNLTFTYASEKNPALKDINMTIEKGSFTVICGKTGCGKTTLLKMLKNELRPYGKLEGEILYNGVSFIDIDKNKSVKEIGFVFQNPNNQIVADKVWNELAFGLENLGVPTMQIRQKIAEMASFFNIEDLFRRNTSNLSGGEKQLLNLASVMVMQPKVLLLDEPTAQLDPISRDNFLRLLQKINDELGTTIILVEHHLEDVLILADKIIVMGMNNIFSQDTVKKTCQIIKENYNNFPLISNFPTSVQLYSAVDCEGECPLNVRQGKRFVESNFTNKIKSLESRKQILSSEKMISLKNVAFRYHKNDADIIDDLSLDIYRGEILAVVGSNGAGKSTLLHLIAGNLKPYQGKIIIDGKDVNKYKNNELYRDNLVLLPQNPDDLFVFDTVREELMEMKNNNSNQDEDFAIRLDEVSQDLKLEELYNKHPFDLSGGQKQKLALAKILLLNPKIILLDEPTKGIDGMFKIHLAGIIKKLQKKGITIVLVTHDIEFSAMICDECALLFDNSIINKAIRDEFFLNNSFYTTAANRITRDMYDNIITVDDAISIIRKNQVL